MFDLDNFKLHNDTHGHSAGDELLVAIADGLRRRLRASDVTGRLGGDEFAVLLPNADAARARYVTQSLLNLIRIIAVQVRSANPRPSDYGGADVEDVPQTDGAVSASIGLVCLDRQPAWTPEGALRAADEALYHAKRGGRNCIAEWAPEAGSFIPASD